MEAEVRNDHLKTGAITSCGCAHAEMLRQRNTTHGQAGTPEWRVWKGMHTRCFNPRSKAWKNYGGRGITICAEWRHDFRAFLRDMGKRPSPDLSIERRDNDGDYCKANCYWATALEQSRNRRPYGKR